MKPGRKTSEFAVTVCVSVGGLAAALEGALSPRWAAVAASVAVGSYAIGRGIAKSGTPGA